MSLLAGPMLQAGTLAAGRPDERAANAEASLPPGVVGKTIEPDKLVVDFRLARQALEEGHSGIYRYTAKEELDGLFDRAEKSLIRPMNAVEFYRILAPVVAAIKCGHTGVGLPEEMQKAYSTKALLLPLQIRVLAGKVYILRDFSDGATTLAGREIRSINGIPAAKIVETMLATTPGDGDSQTCRISRMSGWTLARRLPALLGVQSPYEVTVWDAKENREATVHLEGKELPRLQEAARAKFPQDQRAETAGEFKLKDEGKIAVMKINGFGGFVDTARKKSLREFYRESFEAMNESGTKSLILDLRDNGGGEDELGKLLLSYLLDEPFKYYDDLVINARQFTFQKYTDHTEPLPANLLEVQPDGKFRMVKHPNWGMQQPSKPHISRQGTDSHQWRQFLDDVRVPVTSPLSQAGNVHRRRVRWRLLWQHFWPQSSANLAPFERPSGRAADDLLHGGQRLPGQSARSSPRLSRRIHHRGIARRERTRSWPWPSSLLGSRKSGIYAFRIAGKIPKRPVLIAPPTGMNRSR